MKKTVCSLILSVLFASTLLAQQTDWIKRISMLPIISEKDSVTPVLANVLNDSVGVAARFLPGCAYVDYSVGTDPANVLIENDLDFLITGRVVQENGYKLVLSVYNNSLGTEQTETVTISRSLEIFEVIDGLTEPVLNAVTGTELSYGALEFVNTGSPDLQCRMIINGRDAGENLQKISRIPTGPYEITIQQISDLGTFTVEQAFVRVKENENMTVSFKLENWGELEVKMDKPQEPFVVYINGIEQEGSRFITNSGEQEILVAQIYGENLHEYPVFRNTIVIANEDLTTLEVESLPLGPGIVFQNRGEMGNYRVTVDETVYEGSPYSIPVLPVGEHLVRVEQIFPEGETVTVFQDTQRCRADREIKIKFRLTESRVDPEDLMIYVQGGTFQRKLLQNNGESEDVNVTVNSFYMMKFEVTENLWSSVTGQRSQTSRSWYPVNDATWYEAVEFCNQLSIREGYDPCYIIEGEIVECDFSKNGYRLPTEAEWEWAAKGGIHKDPFIFSGSNSLIAVAMTAGYSKAEYNTGPYIFRADTCIPNSLGLYGMTGNAMEWCWDIFSDLPLIDTIDYRGPLPEITNSVESRVIKGGRPDRSASQLHIEIRESLLANSFARLWNSDFPVQGFRIVRTAEE